jgi:hypothetical protein
MQFMASLSQEERLEISRLNKRYGKRPKQLKRKYKQLCARIIRRKEIEKALKEWEEAEAAQEEASGGV